MQYGEPFYSFTADIAWPEDLPHKASITGSMVITLGVRVYSHLRTINGLTIRLDARAPYDRPGPEVILAGHTYRPCMTGSWDLDSGLRVTAGVWDSTSKKLPAVLEKVGNAVRDTVLVRFPDIQALLTYMLAERTRHFEEYVQDLQNSINLYRDTGDLTFYTSYHFGSYTSDLETLRAALKYANTKSEVNA